MLCEAVTVTTIKLNQVIIEFIIIKIGPDRRETLLGPLVVTVIHLHLLIQ